MTVTAPGQVEWDGLIIWTAPGDGRSFWLPDDVQHSGWDVEWDFGDQRTEAGAAAGKTLIRPMYPALVGVICETAEDYNDLAEAMHPGAGTGELVWWDQPSDRILSVNAAPRGCFASRARSAQIPAHRVADVRWFVARPGDIEVEGS